MSQLLFTGLSAFPLTPIHEGEIDERSFTALVTSLERSADDSIAILGSTGSYMYLTERQREVAISLAASAAGAKPLVVGVGDISTAKVLRHIKVAEQAGAAAVLVAPVSYQPLTAAEVLFHFTTICESTDLPVIVYDNPGVTHFSFDVELYRQLSLLPNVVSLKIPPTFVARENPVVAISQLRSVISDDVSIGISGDGAGARGLVAGCDVWYSAVAGTLPTLAENIMAPWRAGNDEAALQASAQYQPLWDLFAAHGGSLRVIAAIAEEKGLVQRNCLPAPLLPLDEGSRAEVLQVMSALNL